MTNDTESTANPNGSHRLDPFAFPSSTMVLFGLLIVAALSATTFAWNTIAAEVRSDPFSAAVERCTTESGRPPLVGLTSLDQVPGAIEANRQYVACMSDEYRAHLGFLVLGLVLLVALTIVIYAFLPRWHIRRRRYKAIPLAGGSELICTVEGWAREMGLPSSPTLLLGIGDASTSGVAFGHLGRKYIGIPQGLAVLSTRNPRAFKGVLVHELAHLKNRDVDQAYLTIAIWRAFIVVSIVPLIITMVSQGDPVGVAWRTVFLAAVVFGLRNSVLRQRELYADARAANWVDSDEYSELLATMPTRRWWSRLFSYHPESSRRLAVLDDPSLLFQFSIADAVAAGVVAGLILGNATSLLGHLDSLFEARGAITFVVIAPLALALGIGAGRSAFLTLSARSDASRLALGAVAVGPAMLLGRWASFHGSTVPDDVSILRSPYALGWAIALVGVIALVVLWMYGTASLWFPSASTGSATRLLSVAGLGTGALLMTGFLGWLLSVEYLDQLPLIFEAIRAEFEKVSATYAVGPYWLWSAFMGPLRSTLTSQNFVLPSLVMAWVVPLLGLWLLRSRIRVPAHRPFLHGDSVTPERQKLGVWTLIGGAFALAVGLFVLAFRVWASEFVDPIDRASDQFFLAWLFGIPLLISVVALAASTTAAIRSPRHRWVTGLAAGATTAILGTLIVTGLGQFGHCTGFAELVPGACVPRNIVDWATVKTLATPAVVLVAAALGLGHLARAVAGSGDPVVVRRRTAVAGVATVVIAGIGLALLVSPEGGASLDEFAAQNETVAQPEIPNAARADFLLMARALGVSPVIGDDELLALATSYCVRLDNGESMESVIDQVATIQDPAHFELELDALSAAVMTLCDEYASDFEMETNRMGSTSADAADTTTTSSTTTTTTTTTTTMPIIETFVVRDETGSIVVEVPSRWYDTRISATQGGNPLIQAAEDLNAYWDGDLNTEGVGFIVGEWGGDLRDYLEAEGNGFPCEPGPEQLFDDGVFSGWQQRLENCGGLDTEILLVAASHTDTGVTAVLHIRTMDATTRDEIEAIVLGSFNIYENNVFSDQPPRIPPELENWNLRTISVGGDTILVAVADSAEKQQTGAGGIADVLDLDGILYSYPALGPRSHINGNGLFAIDIIMFGPDGAVVFYAEGVPGCSPAECPGHGTPHDVRYVLETPAGHLGNLDSLTIDASP